MPAPVVHRRHLDVQVFARVIPPVVGRRVLDAEVGELDVSVVARQAVLARPFGDLFRAAIRPTVAVGATAIPFLQEALVVPLELVVEDDALDAGATLPEPLGLAEICAEDLRVVLDLAWLLQVRVERLAAISIAVSMRVEQVPP